MALRIRSDHQRRRKSSLFQMTCGSRRRAGPGCQTAPGFARRAHTLYRAEGGIADPPRGNYAPDMGQHPALSA